MKAIWTKAFWKDAAERVGFTFVATILGVVTGTAVATDHGASLGSWVTWSPIVFTTIATALKVMLAGLASPTTGASFGTTVPADLAVAVVNPGEGTVEAGAGSEVPTGTPVSVKPDVPSQL